ncbi:MAG: motility associated factor glycosyltransferase family protein [Verrucomicrobia bacterium]|nr:motility associated factor glycosyltransferase family protein [Verrucomicrobiota bacterium]
MPFSTRYPDLALHLHWIRSEKKELGNAQEALEWKSSLPLDRIDVLYVYGLGGHHAKVLKSWLAENPSRHLVFLEDDLAALRGFSEMPQAEEILAHPQIHVRWIPNPPFWDRILEECAAEFSFDKIEVSALKAYEKLPRFRKIKLSLLRKTVLWNSLTSENISGHLLHENIIPNLRRIPSCCYVNSWKDELKGIPIIICGAGPSLKALADDLHQMRDKALIIACGSALSALSHLGIRPHLGIAIDPNSREFDCLKGCTYRDLPLLFGSRLYPKVFELFDGPYGYIRSGTGSLLESYVEEELNLKDPFLGHDLGREALSVTTLALSLAHAWGCDPIIFAGVDLAYEREKHYAEGVPVKVQINPHEKSAGEQWVRRKGARGHWVSTLVKWIMERDTIDSYARRHPGTTFINASSGGLGFKHIPHRPFQQLCKKTGDYDERIHELVKRTKISLSEAQVENVLASVRNSLEKCLEILRLLQQEDSGSGKAVLYQLDLEGEIAYQLVLSSCKLALERLGKKKDPVALEREKWKFLEEAAFSYLKSF